MAASQLNALGNFSEHYDGRHSPFLGDVFASMGEMIGAKINPGSTQWVQEIQNMGDNHLIRTAGINDDGSAKVYDNAQPNTAEQVSHPLLAALAHHKDLLSRAEGEFRDENEIARLERTIGRIEADIQKLNPSPVPATDTPDKLQLSPEAQARQDAADKEVMDSIAAADEAQAGWRDEDADGWDSDYGDADVD